MTQSFQCVFLIYVICIFTILCISYSWKDICNSFSIINGTHCFGQTTPILCEMVFRKTSSPKGAWKSNFPPFQEIMTAAIRINRSTNQPTNGRTWGVIGKLHFQYYHNILNIAKENKVFFLMSCSHTLTKYWQTLKPMSISFQPKIG